MPLYVLEQMNEQLFSSWDYFFFIEIRCITISTAITSTFSRIVSSMSYIYIIGGVMVSVLVLSAVDRGFEPRSGQTNNYKIGICCFSAKHAALRRKCKDRLPRNRNNMSDCGDMSILGLLFQWASTIKIQISVLV